MRQHIKRNYIPRILDKFLFSYQSNDSLNNNGFKMGEHENVYPLTKTTLDWTSLEVELLHLLNDSLNNIKYNNDSKTKPTKIYDKRLYDYQNKSVDNLMKMKNVGIFNEQRTGKTPTTLITIREKGFKKTIITMKASLLVQWKEEIKLWIDVDPTLIKGTFKQRSRQYAEFFKANEGIMLISYDTLKIDYDVFLDHNFDCMVVDEADFIRNTSTRTKNLLKVRKRCENCFLLTGTPTVNDAVDIISLIHFMYPQVPKWNLCAYFFHIGKVSFGKGRTKMVYTIKSKEHETILQEWMELFTLNTKRADVWELIPNIIRRKIHVPMSPKQEVQYSSMLENYITMDEETEELVTGENILTNMIRLSQLALDPRILPGFKTPGEKTKQIIQYCKDFKEKQIIIFSSFTEYLELLRDDLSKSGIVAGMFTGRNKQSRDRYKKEFQQRKIKVSLVNIKAGGEGLTLSEGDTIIFAQNSFSYKDRIQAEARFLKQDNKEREIIDYIPSFSGPTTHNIEEYILRALTNKKSKTSIINDWFENLKLKN